MYHWTGINEFVAVAETHSFTTASKRLGISTAQVSRQISALENRLSVKLFNRTTRKVSLTEIGEMYYQHCRQLLDGLTAAEVEISQYQSVPSGKLRLTAPITYGEKCIAPLVNDFAVKHPKLNIELSLSNNVVDLIDGDFDLAIRLGKLEDSTLMAKRLASRRQYVCASPDYLARCGEPKTPADLAEHNCLRGHYDYWCFQENGRTQNIRISGNLRYNSGYALADAAVKGLGIVQLPDDYVSQALADKTLLPLLSNFQEPDEGIWAVYPQNRHLLPKVRLLLDYFAKQL